MSGHASDLYKVVDGGFCIGCGACTAVAPRIAIEFNRFGDLVARIPSDVTDSELQSAARVCPFTAGDDETVVAQRIFASEKSAWHADVGIHCGTYAVHSKAHHFAGSSGGVATWLLSTLIQRGLIDAAVHVAPSPESDKDRFFSFRVSSDTESISSGSTSFYYPVSMDEVLAIIKSKPGRYAITGVPCFHKAIRRVRAADKILDERIRYQIGVVCGQMKSAHYLSYLTRMSGADPNALIGACFRRKIEGRPTNDYAFESTVRTADGGTERHQVMNNAIGANWGMGYFKPKACEVCDDVFAETADVAAMDAWLPKYTGDKLDWSLVVARSHEIDSLINQGALDDQLVVRSVPASELVESQQGGLNHRRTALPYRLWLHRNDWTPPKRSAASADLPFVIRMEQRLREILRVRSRELWLKTGHIGNFQAFLDGMRLYEFFYQLFGRIKRLLIR
jgi:coenzyme F420-reducing hydrogenase beta subunit